MLLPTVVSCVEEPLVMVLTRGTVVTAVEEGTDVLLPPPPPPPPTDEIVSPA